MAVSFADTIIFGTKAEVAAALDQGANVLETDEYGFNPLVEAAIMQKVDVAELLLQRGAKVDMPDLTGRTALHWAADNRNLAMCQLLLKHKANPNSYTLSTQPVLVYPLLRGHFDLKQLLYTNGADLHFAQDFINAKLLGHRFSLPGQTHIFSPEGKFILMDYEGFIFEFTANLIQDSLNRFKRNYSARHLTHYTKKIDRILHALQSSSTLIQYQQYSVKIEQHLDVIDPLLEEDLVLIPVVYTGHAVTLIKFQDLLVKCDRGEYGRNHKTVTVYKMPDRKKFASTMMKKILYKHNDQEYIHYGLNKILDLREIHSLPLAPQITGNCSWANVEAVIPAMLFLLFFKERAAFDRKSLADYSKHAMSYFYQWLQWDQDRAIDECIQSFKTASAQRKAIKAQSLAAILVHTCDYKNSHHIERAEKIMKVLNVPQYHYLLDAYVKEFEKNKKDPLAQNLKHLLDLVNYKR